MGTVLDLAFHPLASQYHPGSSVGHDGSNAGMGVITGCLWLAAAILAARRKG